MQGRNYPSCLSNQLTTALYLLCVVCLCELFSIVPRYAKRHKYPVQKPKKDPIAIITIAAVDKPAAKAIKAKIGQKSLKSPSIMSPL